MAVGRRGETRMGPETPAPPSFLRLALAQPALFLAADLHPIECKKPEVCTLRKVQTTNRLCSISSSFFMGIYYDVEHCNDTIVLLSKVYLDTSSYPA